MPEVTTVIVKSQDLSQGVLGLEFMLFTLHSAVLCQVESVRIGTFSRCESGFLAFTLITTCYMFIMGYSLSSLTSLLGPS